MHLHGHLFLCEHAESPSYVAANNISNNNNCENAIDGGQHA